MIDFFSNFFTILIVLLSIYHVFETICKRIAVIAKAFCLRLFRRNRQNEEASRTEQQSLKKFKVIF